MPVTVTPLSDVQRDSIEGTGAFVRGLMHQVVEIWPSVSIAAPPISGSGSGGGTALRRDQSRTNISKDRSRTVIRPTRKPFRINV